VKLRAAAIQMSSEPEQVSANLERADRFLQRAWDQGAELAVLPEMFNTGYCCRRDYADLAEEVDGPTVSLLRDRARRFGMVLAGGFVEHAAGHLYDSLAICQPEGSVAVYRKRHLVFWECRQFRRGRVGPVVATPFGRLGLAICADMIYRTVWREYRGRIDLAVVSAAWPDFRDRDSGRRHWLFGGLGPLASEIPAKVARDLGIPVVFSNQCGETETKVPLWPRIRDRFAGLSTLVDGPHRLPVRADAEEAVVITDLHVRNPGPGVLPCRSTSRLGSEAFSSTSAA